MSNSNQYSTTTKKTTYSYSDSNTGPTSKSTVTEVRTFSGPGGTRTETKTYSYGGNGNQEQGITARHSAPDMALRGSRYSKGWGSRRETRPPAGPPMELEGKTYQEVIQQCQREGRLFEDPDFHADDSSLVFSGRPGRSIEWKRPHVHLAFSSYADKKNARLVYELCDDPKLFVEGASRFDVKQGELGDCWLLAAIAGLTLYEELLFKVVPPKQSFEKSRGYCGLFHFSFWRFGEWVDIFIDDRLPTYRNRLVYMHSKETNEFWTALLEKAYAKLVGSYEALKGGSAAEAMEDFTGGVTEIFDIRPKTKPPNLWTIMLKAFERNSMMGCSIEAIPNQTEARLTNGLICGHAYTITAVRTVEVSTPNKTGKIPMIRIRNPWGNEAEWRGAWCDGSKEWKFISDAEKKKIGLVFDNDGEFWMSFQDFSTAFHKLEICNLGPESPLDEKTHKRKWEGTKQNGCWKRNVNAGGCRNYLETFWTNPQYRVTVTDPDEDDEENLGTIIVGLMQIGRRKLRKEGKDLLTIGYVIYELKDSGAEPLDVQFFKYNQSKARSPSFINMREVCGRHKLKPGNYCIIPSTFEPNHEADFLMRIFSEQKNDSKELDEETCITNVRPSLPPADPDADSQMRAAFKSIAGADMEIDAYELQVILDNAFKRDFKFDGFSAETCRSMVALLDNDRSGKLGFEEFKKLWTDIRMWKTVFKQHDKDKSGNFNSYELRAVFHALGFKLSNSTFNALVKRYTHKDGCIYFDDFVHCIARMKTMFDIYKEMQTSPRGKAEFDLDCFIQTTMYS
ncbi:DgyrCDS10873 [Dimorphilus gyrociliatus]|uniref:DgyrCDS10873 n=1 Tax=Dimorphilus gyrociliatus TaxID=2664684 RepID=A0A7I8W6M8_9ANNE|nr:DgyrCDS10873 [Dimorphilus gyrociliatus]